MAYKSQFPDIQIPKDVNLWDWVLDPKHSPALSQNNGFTNAVTGEHISYKDIKNLTSYLSSELVLDFSLKVGDAISIYARNSVYYPVATLAAVRVGGVACGTSPEYTVDELVSSLRLSKTKIIFTEDDFLDRALEAAQKASIPQRNVILMTAVAGTHTQRPTIGGLIEAGQRRPVSELVEAYKIPAGRTNHDVCAFICFSSGTTGMPKAVAISQMNIIAQCLQIKSITPSDHNKVLAALPFYHITGIVHQLHLPMALNANVYVLPKFNLDNLLTTLERYKIAELLIVPPILIRLVREPETVAKYDLRHVKRFSSGAAPLSKEIITLLEKQFPGTGFKQGYGMSESCSAICSHPPSKYAYKYAHKVGMVVPSTEVRIVDPQTGKDCPVGRAGEVWARGPQVVMGYLDNPKATAETFDKDGFLHTGDIGMFDEAGLLSIMDRMKEMIKVKGIGIAPAELEDLLLGHPAVADCAVCGIADDWAGERPKAFIALAGPHQENPRDAAREILDFVKAKKSRNKWLVEVEIVKAIPKSPAGKILRKELRKPRKGEPIALVRDDRRIRGKL